MKPRLPSEEASVELDRADCSKNSKAPGASGTKTVVFRVGGIIEGNFSTGSNVTIAGQTAPGDGIAIHGTLGFSSSNVIVRYIRVRGKGSGDVISGRGGKNIIFDHVSTSWSGDEVFSLYFAGNVTIQWCMITEACSGSHQFGGIWGNDHSTYHHGLFAHNTDRNPRIASGAGYNDVRNNVIYNWENESIYGCEVHQVGDPSHVGCWTNVVANYFKPGPGTPEAVERATRIASPWSRQGAPDYGKWYVAENYLVGHPEVTADNWLGVWPQFTGEIADDRAAIPGLKLDEPAEFMPIKQQTAEEAYLSVLQHAGCSFPNRDSHDARIIEEVRTGTATHGDGFVSSPTEMPQLSNGTPPPDGDHDGMPDAWESQHGLNPDDPSDGSKIGEGGYTNLENYLNGLVAQNATYVVKEMKRNGLRLAQSRFNATEKIAFSLPGRSHVKLEVFDNRGKSVAILMDETKEAGDYTVDPYGAGLSPGLYVGKLTAAEKTLASETFLIW